MGEPCEEPVDLSRVETELHPTLVHMPPPLPEEEEEEVNLTSPPREDVMGAPTDAYGVHSAEIATFRVNNPFRTRTDLLPKQCVDDTITGHASNVEFKWWQCRRWERLAKLMAPLFFIATSTSERRQQQQTLAQHFAPLYAQWNRLPILLWDPTMEQQGRVQHSSETESGNFLAASRSSTSLLSEAVVVSIVVASAAAVAIIEHSTTSWRAYWLMLWLILVLTLTLIGFSYFYGLQFDWFLNEHRHRNNLFALQNIVLQITDFNGAIRKVLICIQESELLMRGYTVGRKMGPISRLEINQPPSLAAIGLRRLMKDCLMDLFESWDDLSATSASTPLVSSNKKIATTRNNISTVSSFGENQHTSDEDKSTLPVLSIASLKEDHYSLTKRAEAELDNIAQQLSRLDDDNRLVKKISTGCPINFEICFSLNSTQHRR